MIINVHCKDSLAAMLQLSSNHKYISQEGTKCSVMVHLLCHYPSYYVVVGMKLSFMLTQMLRVNISLLNSWAKCLNTSAMHYQVCIPITIFHLFEYVTIAAGNVKHQRTFPKEFLKEGYPNLIVVQPGKPQD